MPDELHAQAPTETLGCDCHEGIPRDSAGVPTYFILPPADRAYYEEKLAGFEKAWEATKDPAWFAHASAWADLFRQPHPPWLSKASQMVAARQRTKDDDRRYRKNQSHLLRYQTVRAHREAGCSEDEALDRAVKELAKIRGEAAARSTIEDSYNRMKREFKAKRFGYYKPFVQGRFRTINGRPAANAHHRRARP
jgi:hypothetical protein